MNNGRKDMYSSMPTGDIGGFGEIEREGLVSSPMRSRGKKRKRVVRKEEFAKEETSKSLSPERQAISPDMENMSPREMAMVRALQKRLDSFDDEVLDIIFPIGDDDSIDAFLSMLDQKGLFGGLGGWLRRALTKRRGRRKSKSMSSKLAQGPCWDGYVQAGMKKGKGGKMVPNCVPIGKKSLDKWFKEDWVDLSRPKKGGGFEPCGRRDADSGKYPKCVPAAKAAKMTPGEIASAVRRKRKAESSQTRVDKKPINVSTDKKDAWFAIEEKAAIPTNPELYARVKAQAKKKFDVYPSAYANAWLVREYKKRGGGYRTGKKTLGSNELSYKATDKPRLRDPKGGLTAAGRAHFKRTEGSNLKPGVKGAADTPDKMRRKGSFLTRFFTNPSGPMVGKDGKPTRLALSAAAWGEPVPKNRSDAAKLAAKGRRLLERYENTKKKK